MKFRLVVISIAWGLLQAWPTPSGAVEDHCIPRSLELAWVGSRTVELGQVLPTIHEDSKTILVISDGIGVRDKTLGRKLAETYPDKMVVSGDVFPPSSPSLSNYRRIRLDNRRPFVELGDDTFDSVILANGMCMCKSAPAMHCCAGFIAVSDQARSFLSEAIRVLNKKNPNAKLVLHANPGGTGAITKVVQDAWRSYLTELETRYGVRATMNFDDEGRFRMITVVPR